MPDVTGVCGLLPAALGKIRAAVIGQRHQGDQQERSEFLHEAFASCAGACGCGCGVG